MKRATLVSACIVVAVGLGASALRLPGLDERPMHPDESVQASKTVALYETGYYRYDPRDHHGPTLYYLALPSILLTAGGDAVGADDATFRLVPALFGIGLVLLVWLVRDGLGRAAAACAAILTAVSPAMVFYSRYFIQEMSLVFFTFLAIAAGWRYARSGSWGWALAAGLAVGLMHATKETCIMAFAAMGGALGLVLVLWRRHGASGAPKPAPGVRGWPIALAAAVAVLVSVLLFSSFFTNLQGPLDSVRTYDYLVSRGHEGGVHNHAWDYYLGMLACSKDGEWVGWRGLWDVLVNPKARIGPVWTEALILGLALLGMIAAFTRRGIAAASAPLLRFLAFYTLLMTIAYSSIPYKTPWCMIGFLHGMILLAGVGAVALVRWLRRRPMQIAASIVLVLGGVHLGVQAYQASFRFHSDACNPYAYAQTYTNIFKLRDRIDELAAADGGRAMLIKVVSPENYWPLPWYLRVYEGVGYWDQVPASPDAPVIVASPAVQADLEAKLRDKYQQGIYGLRPGVFLVLYVKQDLWDAFMAARRGPPPK